MNPNDIRFSQATIPNQGNGYTVQGNIEGLQNGTLSPDAPPFSDKPISVFVKEPFMDEWGPASRYGHMGDPSNLTDGEVYTLDNRRLYAFQQAGITDIPVEWAEQDTVFRQRYKFSTQNGGTSVELLP